MKKLFVFAMMALVSSTAAFAQWNTDATPVTVFSTANYNGLDHAVSIKAVRTPDKKTWLSWKKWDSILVNGFKVLADRTYLQLLDINGVPQFEEPLVVNNHMTPSWHSDYSLCVAADGSAIVTLADARLEENEVTEDDQSAYTFCPAIYKIDQEGNFLWGLDGIAFEEFNDSPFTLAYVVGEDTYFGFNLPTSEEGNQLYIYRIDDDGTLGWEEPMIVETIQCEIVPSLDGDFLFFDDCNDGARVRRLNRNGEDVWSEPIIYDPNKYSGYALHQYKAVPDGDGGAAVAFVRAMGQFSHNIRVQHVNADGSLGFGLEGLDAANTEDNDYDYCGVAVNPNTQEIMVDFESQLESTYDVMLQKFSYDGEYLFDELGLSIAHKNRSNTFSFARVGIGSVGESDWIVSYRDVEGYGARNSFIIRRYDKDGNRVWTKTIGRNLDCTAINMIVEPEATYLFYREFSEEKGPGVKMFRIGSDGTYNVTYDIPEDPTCIKNTNGVSTASKRYFTVDGRQISQPQSGLNIVKDGNGSVRKYVIE